MMILDNHGGVGVCAPGLYPQLSHLSPGVYRSPGLGALGFNHASMAAVNYWFLTKRGLAMSILQTGQAIGGVVFLPLVALAVLKLAWRSAAMLLEGLSS